MPNFIKPIPEGFHTATPTLVVKNAAQAIDYYKKVFGAEELMRMPSPDGKYPTLKSNRRFKDILVG